MPTPRGSWTDSGAVARPGFDRRQRQIRDQRAATTGTRAAPAQRPPARRRGPILRNACSIRCAAEPGRYTIPPRTIPLRQRADEPPDVDRGARPPAAASTSRADDARMPGNAAGKRRSTKGSHDHFANRLQPASRESIAASGSPMARCRRREMRSRSTRRRRPDPPRRSHSRKRQPAGRAARNTNRSDVRQQAPPHSGIDEHDERRGSRPATRRRVGWKVRTTSAADERGDRRAGDSEDGVLAAPLRNQLGGGGEDGDGECIGVAEVEGRAPRSASRDTGRRACRGRYRFAPV